MPNLLIAKILESNNLHKICSYNGTKILLSSGKLVDEEKFYENCELCIACSQDFSSNFLYFYLSKDKYLVKNDFYHKKLFLKKRSITLAIRDPPLN